MLPMKHFPALVKTSSVNVIHKYASIPLTSLKRRNWWDLLRSLISQTLVLKRASISFNPLGGDLMILVYPFQIRILWLYSMMPSQLISEMISLILVHQERVCCSTSEGQSIHNSGEQRPPSCLASWLKDSEAQRNPLEAQVSKYIAIRCFSWGLPVVFRCRLWWRMCLVIIHQNKYPFGTGRSRPQQWVKL